MPTQRVRHRRAAKLRASYGAGRSGAATVLGRNRDRIPLEHAKHSQSATTQNDTCTLWEIQPFFSLTMLKLFGEILTFCYTCFSYSLTSMLHTNSVFDPSNMHYIWSVIQSLFAKKRCSTLWPKLGYTQSLLSFFVKSSRRSSSAKSSETMDVCSFHTIGNAHITQHITWLFSILYHVKTWIKFKKLICFQFISIFQGCHGPGPCKVLKEGSFFIWPVQLTALFLQAICHSVYKCEVIQVRRRLELSTLTPLVRPASKY